MEVIKVKSTIRKRSLSPEKKDVYKSSPRIIRSDFRPKPKNNDIKVEVDPGTKIQNMKEDFQKLSNTRAGGAYIPPAKLRLIQEKITDKESEEYQKISWEALKKSINGLINKINTSNIQNIIPELFFENLIRGRGLFCRSIMKAQSAALPFTPVYASAVAVINTKLPKIGKLLVKRLVLQFRRAYKRNDKTVCLSTLTFIAHLVNQQVSNELLALQILALLLINPTDDSVELAVGFIKEVGQHLTEFSKDGINGIFDRFRAILHEAEIDKRVQYMVEVLFQIRKNKFTDNPTIPDGLDLVEAEDKIPHDVRLDSEFRAKDELNFFKFNPNYAENEKAYVDIKNEILGENDSEDEDENDNEQSDENEDEDEENNESDLKIQDKTGSDLINLRRSIFLTIMSSLDSEECAHKLMKINLQPGDEFEFCNMIVECCSQERTYLKIYGFVGERFCKINSEWAFNFEKSFVEAYETIHRYETNRLRNVANFFAHLIARDGIPWPCLSIIKLTDQDTTSSSRIFIKILFTELVGFLGLNELNEKLKDPLMEDAFSGLFPTDSPKNTRFAINYFTSIGLGGLTEELREHLKTAPKPTASNDSSSDSEGSSSSSDSDSSDSD